YGYNYNNNYNYYNNYYTENEFSKITDRVHSLLSSHFKPIYKKKQINESRCHMLQDLTPVIQQNIFLNDKKFLESIIKFQKEDAILHLIFKYKNNEITKEQLHQWLPT